MGQTRRRLADGSRSLGASLTLRLLLALAGTHPSTVPIYYSWNLPMSNTARNTRIFTRTVGVLLSSTVATITFADGTWGQASPALRSNE